MSRRPFALFLVLLVASRRPLPTAAQPASPLPSPAGDWPEYRGNAARTGATAAPGPGPAAAIGWRLASDGLTAPVVAAGTLSVGDDLGKPHLVDAATGVDRELDVDPYGDRAVPTGIAAAGGAVFDLLLDGTLRVVDLATGGERWTAVDLSTDVAPLIAGGTVYLADSTGGIVVLDAASGARRWTYTPSRTVPGGYLEPPRSSAAWSTPPTSSS